MTIDPAFGGVYVENPDGSKTIIMKPNDGSSTITTDTGIIAIDTASTHFNTVGVCNYNQMNGTFSGLTTATTNSDMSLSYCYALQKSNTFFRQYGYEVIPLYESATGSTSSFIGISKIINNSSQTKPALQLYSTGGTAYEEGLYKSAKDMFMTTSHYGTRAKITKGNASIVEWRNKVIANSMFAVPFEIREVVPSLYKRTVTGRIANRDGLVLSSVRPSSFNAHSPSNYSIRTLNITTGDPSLISSDIFLSLTQPDGSVSYSQSNTGDIYTCQGLGYTFDYNHSTKEFTLSTTLQITTVISLGFTQPEDLVIENYAGWVKYPVGLNSDSDKFNLLEIRPHIYMLIMAYNSAIDEV